MKFGGTSVADVDAMRRLTGIVARGSGPRVVVVSALAGVTDRLLELGALAGEGRVRDALPLLDALDVRHRAMVEGLTTGERRHHLMAHVNELLASLRAVVGALGVLREVTPRSLDSLAAFGELLSSRIAAAAIAEAGLGGTWVDARRVIVTTGDHTRALPLSAQTSERLQEVVAPLVEAGRLPVVGGYVAATVDGVTTTLGRGGSDYSAAIVGAALNASEIQIWTDVDGMLTADPRVVAGTRIVRRLSFSEAAELAYFGAKVLHPSTILPAVERDIPVRIVNSRQPDAPGTLITAQAPESDTALRALACKRDVTVIDITSTRMLMAYGFLQRVFEVFARFETAVDVVTTSEVSVSVTIDNRRHLHAIRHALEEFAEVVSDIEMALVCVVGERLRSDRTLFAQVVTALDGIPLRMVSQAGSRRNLTFVLPQTELADAMARLHERFFEAPTHTVSAPAAGRDTGATTSGAGLSGGRSSGEAGVSGRRDEADIPRARPGEPVTRRPGASTSGLS